jgi:amidohydrolase
MPDRTVDPIVAQAQLVLALQTIVSRRTAPLASAVVSIGAVHGGDAFNAIPDRVSLTGTVRAFSDAEERRLEDDVRRAARGIGDATGTAIEVAWNRHTRPTVNDPAAAALVSRAAREVPGVGGVLSDYRTMAGEDFGEVLARVPGCYALVGSAPRGSERGEPHHSPRFDIDEDVLAIAAGLHVRVVEVFAKEAP